MNRLLTVIVFVTGVACVSEIKAQQYWTADHGELTVSNVSLPSKLTTVQHGNLELLCRVWGILKYFHPKVASGEMDADRALFAMLPKTADAKNSRLFQHELIAWINELGEVPLRTADTAPDNIFREALLAWMQDASLEKELTQKLVHIVKNRHKGKKYYSFSSREIGNPEFTNELKYTKSSGDDDGMRMLALFRYWNTIEYFFPSKYITADNWDSVLHTFIPRFAACEKDKDYRLLCVELSAAIHDTHAANIISDSLVQQFIGQYTLPLWLGEVEEHIAVLFLVYDSIKNTYPIQPGDRILAINGKDVKQLIREASPYVTASNAASFMNHAANRLKRSNNAENVFTILRKNTRMEVRVQQMPLKDLSTPSFLGNPSAVYPMYRLFGKDVGYINIGKIKADSLPVIFEKFSGTSGLVIDLRNYPAEFMPFKLGRYLKPLPSPFVMFTNPDYDMPGRFLERGPYNNGDTNTDFYKGRITILVNAQTQSQAEYTAMALRTAPNAVVIGSQTSGADGNVSLISFPGGISSYMSGLGVYYPDKRPTQGIGIVPDIEMKVTIKGLAEGRDELLERAIQYIRKGQ